MASRLASLSSLPRRSWAWARRGLARFTVPLSSGWRFAVVPIATFAVVLVQRAVHSHPSVSPYVLLIVAVTVSAWLGGRVPGLLAVALSAAVGNFAFFNDAWGWDTSHAAVTSMLLFVASGTIIALLAASFRSALIAQQRARQRQVLALEAGQSGSFEWNVRTGAVEWSDELLALYGMRRQPANRSPDGLLSCIVEEDRASVRDAILRSLQTGDLTLSFRMRRRDSGELRWMQGRGRVTFDEVHRPLALVGIQVDVTDRQRAEERRRELEARYRILFDAIDQGFCVVEVLFDPGEKPVDVRFLEVNRAFAGQTGLVDALGKRMRELAPGQEEAWFETFGKVALTGQPVRFQRRAEALGGRWFDVYVFPFGKREARQVAILAQDITERIQAEEAVRRANLELTDADRRKNEFLGVLSHELRNPLAPIRNSTYVLERAAPGSEQARHAIAVIDRQVTHMTRLIDDLLDVTRIGQGKIRLRREPVLLNDIVRGTAEDLRVLFLENGIELEVDVAPAPLRMNADRTRLAQVVGNLLQNAAKFTPRGGRVRIALGRDADGLAAIEVRDNGAGIAPELLGRLFAPFVQGESTLARTRGGLGLGLALVKGLVELHGGAVSAASEGEGKGAVFRVRFPVEAHAGPRLARVPRRAPARACRVLVIEDNTDAALTLKDALELDGHAVEVAFTAAEGILKARSLAPDVVLCDIGLPDVDGYEVARTLRADARLKTTLLVALSGYAQQEDRDRSARVGFDRHMAKPPDIPALESLFAARLACSVPG